MSVGAIRMHSGDSMRALKRGQDALRARQPHRGVERRLIRRRNIFGAPGIVQRRMLRTDRGVVETRGDGMRQRNLAGVVLQQIRDRSPAARPAIRLESAPHARPVPSPRPPASTPISRTCASGMNS